MKRILLLCLFMTSTAFASASRTLDGALITNGSATITLPTTTGTLCGKDETCTLTNKSLSGAANTFSLIPVGAIGNGSVLSGSNSGDVTLGTANGLSLSGQILSLQAADSTHTGALTSSDWTLFNGKLSSSLTSANIFVGNGSNVATGVALSGDATISNSGVLTIGSKKIQASKLDSGAATSGYIATADGSGGVAYLAPPSVAPSLNGGSASPQSVTAVGGISLASISYSNMVWVAGNAGAVTVTATPSITACTADGQTLKVFGTSATNTVKLQDKNNLASSGLSLNGDWIGGLDSVLNLHCDITASLWVEDSRR